MGFICAVTDRSSNHTEVVGNKKSFNTDSAPFDKASRLNCQLKFFGFKPKRFISSYAKKPRIICKVKSKGVASLGGLAGASNKIGNDVDRQMSALYQHQMMQGIQNSAQGYGQLAMAQNAMMQPNRGYILDGAQAKCGLLTQGGMFGGQFI